MQKILHRLLLAHHDDNEEVHRPLVNNLLIIEDYISEQFYLFIRLVTVVLYSLGYFILADSNIRGELDWVVFTIIGLQAIQALVFQLDQLFSRRLVLASITIDALCLLGLFFAIALVQSFQAAVNSELLVYLHVIFLVTQVIRISKVYVLFATALLVVGRFSIYFYFRFFSDQEVHFVGSATSAIIRYLSIALIVAIVFYASTRLKRIAYKAIKEYLIKNNLIVRNKQLLQLAIVDEVTGLYIHRYFQVHLAKELERSYRKKLPLSLLLIDIDHFKEVNDKFGHLRGDDVLRAVSDLLKKESREYDICARYGGDELAVILPETGEGAAVTTAERMRNRIEEEFLKREETVTISVGAAVFNSRRKIDSQMMLAEADRAMYQSKDMGRNRVTIRKV